MLANELILYIYENDKVEFILENIGCHHITSSAKEFRCGLPNHTNKTSVSVKKTPSLKGKIFYSNNASVGGDIITIVMEVAELKFIDALKHIHQLLDLDFKPMSKSTEVKQSSPLDIFNKIKMKSINRFSINDIPTYENDCLDEYIPNLHISWLREGILSFTAKEFGIGFDEKSRRIVIPHRSYSTGEIVGIIGRTTIENSDMFDIPKYFPLKAYSKSVNLYGIFENYDTIQKAGYCVVGESEKFVLKRHSRLDGTCTALCCHDMSDEQYRILLGLDVDIIISLDKGISEEYIWSICNRFYGVRKIYYTFDKYNILEDKESISDKSNKIYNWFINNKIEFDDNKRREYLKWQKDYLANK